MVELDVKIEARDLYDYMLQNTYSSTPGILGSTVGAVAVLLGVSRDRTILVIAGILLLLYLPWTLFLKSQQQILRTPAFKQPLHYVLDERGIAISQNGEEDRQEWKDMVKAVSTGHSIIVYTSRRTATIFPKRAMGDKRTAVIEMISTHMPSNRVKIRN